MSPSKSSEMFSRLPKCLGSQLNENLDCHHDILLDIFAIKACRRTDNEIVGDLPREISRPTMYRLDRGAVIAAIFTSDS